MAVGEERQTQKHRRKMPSFSSSLLDAIYHSIDDPLHHPPPPPPPPHPHRRNAVDEEIESLRRAIMIEKWMENHTTTAAARHLPSTSASSTDSSSCIFTSSETDSSATPKTAPFPFQKPKQPEREGRFTRTKSRALKIYGDLKKVKEPISPGGRIANFINSIFSPRNLKKENHPHPHPAVRKSRSMKDSTAAAASRSCLTKNTTTTSSRNNTKSKRSVRFCPVSVNILDEHSAHRRIYDDVSMSAAAEVVGSRFIKKNIDSIRLYENHDDHIQRDFDDKSCASSDLFELENFGAYEAELPVYETTNLRMMNRAIAFASRD